MFELVTLGLRLKGCPRCKGDLIFELDQWGLYEQCLQCGYLRDLQDVDAAKQQQVQQGKKEVAQPM